MNWFEMVKTMYNLYKKILLDLETDDKTLNIFYRVAHDPCYEDVFRLNGDDILERLGLQGVKDKLGYY